MAQTAVAPATTVKKKKKKTQSSNSGGSSLFSSMFRKKKTKSSTAASVITEEEMALEWESPSLNKKKLREDREPSKTPRPRPKLTKIPWFCRTKYFQKMCNDAFDSIDADGSGNVDATELYSGLLLIHLKLGMYAGPAACRPLSKERAEAVFHKFDVDDSGSLDRNEFQNAMTVLFGNVFFRVLVQWALTLMVVPMVAQAIIDGVVGIWMFTLSTVQNLDEHSDLANSIELSLESAASWSSNYFVGFEPYTEKVGEYVAMVPESVWETIPLTLISTVLGIVVVPWCIFQVDNFFQRVAEENAEKPKEE